VRRALADAAVGDRRRAVVEALLAVQLVELLVGAEGAVVGGRLAPRDVDGGRHVAGPLGLLLRQVRGALILPLNSSGLRTSTRFLEPIEAMTSSRKARIDRSGSFAA
jgi:hypothetical protein